MTASRAFSWVFARFVRVYQLLHAPFFHNVCRFEPSCSNYAIEAVQVHGPIRGLYLAVRRVLKCQPFHKGGFDFVPPRASGHRGCCCK